MTNDDILKVARDHGIWDDSEELITFAHQIAAMQREIDAGVYLKVNKHANNVGATCAEAIRNQNNE